MIDKTEKLKHWDEVVGFASQFGEEYEHLAKGAPRMLLALSAICKRNTPENNDYIDAAWALSPHVRIGELQTLPGPER